MFMYTGKRKTSIGLSLCLSHVKKDNNLVGNILLCLHSNLRTQTRSCTTVGHLPSRLPPNEASYEHLTAHTLELHVKKKNATIITTST